MTDLCAVKPAFQHYYYYYYYYYYY
jgi:hypothetical protein